ncbi:hypothetical protein FB451DRAFT_1189705 [Mycena latifolia]|nr:hypothetical protein FB451DRAFT_1189705 [Mycena latifolia]
MFTRSNGFRALHCGNNSTQAKHLEAPKPEIKAKGRCLNARRATRTKETNIEKIKTARKPTTLKRRSKVLPTLPRTYEAEATLARTGGEKVRYDSSSETQGLRTQHVIRPPLSHEILNSELDQPPERNTRMKTEPFQDPRDQPTVKRKSSQTVAGHVLIWQRNPRWEIEAQSKRAWALWDPHAEQKENCRVGLTQWNRFHAGNPNPTSLKRGSWPATTRKTKDIAQFRPTGNPSHPEQGLELFNLLETRKSRTSCPLFAVLVGNLGPKKAGINAALPGPNFAREPQRTCRGAQEARYKATSDGIHAARSGAGFATRAQNRAAERISLLERAQEIELRGWREVGLEKGSRNPENYAPARRDMALWKEQMSHVAISVIAALSTASATFKSHLIQLWLLRLLPLAFFLRLSRPQCSNGTYSQNDVFMCKRAPQPNPGVIRLKLSNSYLRRSGEATMLAEIGKRYGGKAIDDAGIFKEACICSKLPLPDKTQHIKLPRNRTTPSALRRAFLANPRLHDILRISFPGGSSWQSYVNSRAAARPPFLPHHSLLTFSTPSPLC